MPITARYWGNCFGVGKVEIYARGLGMGNPQCDFIPQNYEFGHLVQNGDGCCPRSRYAVFLCGCYQQCFKWPTLLCVSTQSRESVCQNFTRWYLGNGTNGHVEIIAISSITRPSLRS